MSKLAKQPIQAATKAEFLGVVEQQMTSLMKVLRLNNLIELPIRLEYHRDNVTVYLGHGPKAQHRFSWVKPAIKQKIKVWPWDAGKNTKVQVSFIMNEQRVVTNI